MPKLFDYEPSLNMKRNIWKTFIVLVIAILCWYLLAIIISGAKETENLTIFVAAKQKTDYTIDAKWQALMQEEGIKRLEVRTFDYQSGSFMTSLATVGLLSSDILVVPQGVAKILINDNNIACIDKYYQFMDSNSTFEYLENDNKRYGIKVSEANNEDYNNFSLSKIFKFYDNDFTEDFYIIFNKESHNIGNVGLDKNHQEAFTLIKKILSKDGN